VDPRQVERLESEIRAQREEVARLRTELSHREQERQRLDQMVDTLQSLDQQIASARSSIAQRTEAVDSRFADLIYAMDLLRTADEILATGSYDVGSTLAEAASLLTGPAQLAVIAAEQSLAQSDLYTTRLNLQWALSVAATNRVAATTQPVEQP
jgi:hypothetical protein